MQNPPDYTAQAINHFLQHIAPDTAALLAPYIAKLLQAMADGHSFITLSPSQCNALTQAKPLVNQHNAPLILSGNRLFFGKIFSLEQQLAQEIQRLSRTPITLRQPETMQTKLSTWFAGKGSEDQQAAAALALISPFLLISGGPGTGKTTTVASLLALLCQQDTLPEIRLVAPTGKAAARMTESLHAAVQKIPDLPQSTLTHLRALNGQTVHRLIGLTPPQMQPRYHQQNPITADILLLDEASMLDSYLLFQLLNALPDGCRVILLGDANQLPPVGMGAILHALTQSPALSDTQIQAIHSLLPHRTLPETLRHQHAHLRISHRFTQDSAIGQLALAVLAGHSGPAWQMFHQEPNFLQQSQATHATIAQALLQRHEHYWQAIAANDIQAAFKALSKIMVLTATQQDAQGINQAYIRQCGAQTSPNQFFAGQVIMVSRNDHTQKLYNGDVGIVHQHHGQLTASFQQGAHTRNIAVSRLPQCDTAYAITVHKSQGSEYDEVWFIAPENPQNNTRALLYTAITRAKKCFHYIGNQNGFQAACHNTDQRRSLLAEHLYGNTPRA